MSSFNFVNTSSLDVKKTPYKIIFVITSHNHFIGDFKDFQVLHFFLILFFYILSDCLRYHDHCTRSLVLKNKCIHLIFVNFSQKIVLNLFLNPKQNFFIFSTLLKNSNVFACLDNLMD